MPHSVVSPDWRWRLHGAANTTSPMAELTHAKGRSITWKLDGSVEATFTLDGRSDIAPLVSELVTDLRVVRDNEPLFHGRIGASNDNIEADSHDTQFSAVDYKALLDRQEVRNPALSYSAVTQGSIVRQLIAYAQSRPGANFGISATSATVPDTAITRTIQFDTGKWVGEAISDMSTLEDGFDFWVDPDLVARLAYPARGVGRDLVCEYGSTVEKVTRSFDPANYGNAVMVTGAQGLAAKVADAGDISTRPEGRFGTVESYQDIGSSTVLQSRANRSLAERSAITPAYSCQMTPGRWNPRELWVGDTTWLVVKSGRLNIRRQERVTEVKVDIDDENVETVTLTLGLVPATLKSRLRSYTRRFQRLERLGAV